MRKPVAEEPSVQVELSLAVLRRLLRERSLVASELRYLNSQSCRAARAALLAALTAGVYTWCLKISADEDKRSPQCAR